MKTKTIKTSIIGIFILLVSFMSTEQVNASNYKNYFGIEMTNQEYNTLINLGFSEDEIYYMNDETYLENKDANATLVSKNTKYYKTIYTDLSGNPYNIEITKDEYENQPNMNTRGTVNTEYKQMVSTISQNGSKYRFKVSLGWKIIPSTKSFDIIGVGYDNDNIYIDSSVYFNYYWCDLDGDCRTDASYNNKKSTDTGGAAVFDFPDTATSLSAALFYDISKNTSSTITSLRMCGDYAHATSNVSVGSISNYNITYDGLLLGSSIINKYDEIPCAISTWSGSW